MWRGRPIAPGFPGSRMVGSGPRSLGNRGEGGLGAPSRGLVDRRLQPFPDVPEAVDGREPLPLRPTRPGQVNLDHRRPDLPPVDDEAGDGVLVLATDEGEEVPFGLRSPADLLAKLRTEVLPVVLAIDEMPGGEAPQAMRTEPARPQRERRDGVRGIPVPIRSHRPRRLGGPQRAEGSPGPTGPRRAGGKTRRRSSRTVPFLNRRSSGCTCPRILPGPD